MLGRQNDHVCTHDCTHKLPSLFFDKNGESITKQRFQELRMDMSYLLIGIEKFEDIFVDVVTVWRGNDYRLGMDPKPLIFETTVNKHGVQQQVIRYSTLQQAQDGHRSAARSLSERKSDQDEIKAQGGTETLTVGML